MIQLFTLHANMQQIHIPLFFSYPTFNQLTKRCMRVACELREESESWAEMAIGRMRWEVFGILDVGPMVVLPICRAIQRNS